MITETETAFLAVIRAFLTEEKASPAEIQGLTEKQWNHLFVLAAQHSLLSAVYDVCFLQLFQITVYRFIVDSMIY